MTNIPRKAYLDKLIAHMGNKRVKIITGIRRAGKSYLLFHLFKQCLVEQGIKPSQIIEIQLEDRSNKELRDPDVCLNYIKKHIRGKKTHYLLLDEVQLMPDFADVLNSCLLIDNLDTFVTGSNSKFLSKDVITEFRGRGDEIYLPPLSFSEFVQLRQNLTFEKAWDEYSTYGGLPYCVLLPTHAEKDEYLKSLFVEVYLKDLTERHHIQYSAMMEKLMNVISSDIGSLTNLRKLERTFKSEMGETLSVNTIGKYLEYMEDAFMISKCERYDVKGRKYISTQQKYYFTDLGLRNAWLNFRQYEETHLMENAIYNELRNRGYSVDVGVVDILECQADGKYIRKQIEIDFVCNKGAQRVYVQSAFQLSSNEKEQQEKRPLIKVDDSFRKFIVIKDDITHRQDANGVITISLRQLLTDKDCLE